MAVRVSSGGRLAQAMAWNAHQLGLKAMSFDPGATGISTASLATGRRWYVRLATPELITVANIVTHIWSAGSGLTVALAGLHNQAGTLIGSTADQSSVWNSGGSGSALKSMAVTAESGQSLTVGGTPDSYVFVQLLAVGTTVPQILVPSVSNAQALNLGLATGASRASNNGAGGQTTLATAVNMSSSGTELFWVGLS